LRIEKLQTNPLTLSLSPKGRGEDEGVVFLIEPGYFFAGALAGAALAGAFGAAAT
jgi:hypothetical protein